MKARIKELREAKGMSRKELADALCVSPRTVEAWEQGRNELRVDAAIDVCRVLGCRLPELCGVDESPIERVEYCLARLTDEELLKVEAYARGLMDAR